MTTTTTEKTETEISRINDRILSRLVDREVLHCISSLVSHFAQNQEACVGDVDSDDVMNLCGQLDYETTWENADLQVLKSNKGDLYIVSNDDAKTKPFFTGHPEGDDGYDEWLESVGTLFDDGDETSYRELCDAMNIDCDDYIEAYEHWAVTSRFAEKLAEHGQITGELFNFHVWGQCTTGQSISIDGVIRDIARSMGILYGQDNCWANADGSV